jgi:phosphoribosylaminoimidazole carboxylase (NCAIR synthetase)
VKDWQKRKLKIALEKLTKKQVLTLIDRLNPEFWTIKEKEEAKMFVEGGGKDDM